MIEFDRVAKTYPGTHVGGPDGISFVVPQHATVALVGSSGCGKTTLLRMVNHMISPTSGRVLVGGRDVRDLDPIALRRSIGYVQQGAGLLPHRTVADNIATVPLLNGTPKASARAHAVDLLDVVGLGRELAARYPAQLSGGQQQRVAVARALAADPDILLMDEPFAAVDPIVRRELQAQVRRLQADLGKTVLLVTHDIDEAFALADEVVLLRPGGIVAQQGKPADLLTRPADDFVAEFIGLNSAARQLRVDRRDGVELVTDGSGLVIGRLTP